MLAMICDRLFRTGQVSVVGLIVALSVATSAGAALIDPAVQDFPTVFADNTGSLSYDSGTKRLLVDADPISMFDPAFGPPAFFLPGGTATIDADVDNSGNLIGGTFTLTGSVDPPNPAEPPVAGTLLMGNITAFGFADTSPGAALGTDTFDLIVSITGGTMAGSYPAQDLYIRVDAENSNFANSFAGDFSSDPTKVNIFGTPAPPPAACFLVIDEDSIDNGNPPNFFDDIVNFGESGADVNDDISALSQRRELRFFDANEGAMIKLHTGEVGDEGWFAPKSFPQSWSNTGPTGNAIRNFVGNPGLDGAGSHGPFEHWSSLPYNVGEGLGTCDPTENNCEDLLDKIPDVTPLRATGLANLVGRTCCAVVYDSDISINFDPLNGSLKGENLGTVAFTVDAATKLEGFSSSTLPEMDITIRDAETVCEGDLEFLTDEDAPAPDSSSEPFDIDPGNAQADGLEGDVGGDGPGCGGNTVMITRAKYSNSRDRLKVFAEHPSATASLTVTVDGYVDGEAMTYKARKDRHQYFLEVGDNLDGLEVIVTDQDGECDTSPIH